jgi:hypothetical protein
MRKKKWLIGVGVFQWVFLLAFSNGAAASFESEFNDEMLLAQENINAKNYDQALASVKKLRMLIAEDEDAGSIEKAWVYDFQRYALYESGRKEEAFVVCEEAIADIGGDAFEWQYLKEHHVVRRTLRACFNMLAWANMEKATSIREMGAAINYIEQAFYTVAVTEEDSVVDEFRETKARVYLKAMSFDKRYQARAFNALSVLAKGKYKVTEDKKIIEAALADTDFIAYQFPVVPAEGSVKKFAAASPALATMEAEVKLLVDGCFKGSMQECDDLYAIALSDSSLEQYGYSCGGRAPDAEEDCVQLAQKKWQKKMPKAKKPPKKLTPNAVVLCDSGNMRACDILNENAPAGSTLAYYGYSCGGRFELLESSCNDLLYDEELED